MALSEPLFQKTPVLPGFFRVHPEPPTWLRHLQRAVALGWLTGRSLNQFLFLEFLMKLILSNGGVPAGSYVAKFLGVEATEPNQYGPGIRWNFEIVSGPQVGAHIGRPTGVKPTPKNKCGQFLIGISGKSVLGEEIDLSAYVGRNYLIVVVNRPEGGTSLDSVSAPPVN
jgi:hypothetical protein